MHRLCMASIAAFSLFLPFLSFAQILQTDSLLKQLAGCWKWDYYYGGRIGLPPTRAYMDVRLVFRQTSQTPNDSAFVCETYKESVLTFSGRCYFIQDTLVFPLPALSCSVFDSIGIVGSAPIFFELRNDTLLFPQEQLLDGFVYAFTRSCDAPTGSTTVFMPGIYLVPNPASRTVYIALPDPAQASVFVLDIQGKVIQYIPHPHASPLQIPATHWPAGAYWALIRYPHKRFLEKFLVTH
ncbi:MAG: hypothetical protein KatS3mg031_0348 [Chitinophagales bacterium]|nr:MAG: hypothetical protein KatS3mg031_0348 [Chitinophagales bacterium]